MNKFLKISLILFLITLCPKISFSLTSASYLIANSAFYSFDYETANTYFNNNDTNDLNITELRKRMLSCIISKKLKKANSLAIKIIELDNNNEDALIVILTFAKLSNDLNEFNKFINLNNDSEIINYVFYDENKIIYNNNDIAKNLFNLVRVINSPNSNFQKNIDYYLFYLNLALNFKPNFNEVLFFQAQIYQQLEYYSKAEKIYNNIQQDHDLYIEAQKNIIIIKKNIKQFDIALKLLINLIDTFHHNNSLIVLQADLYRLKSEYNKAIDLYSSLINKKNLGDIQLWRMYFLRAICYEKLNKWKQAEKNLLQALKFQPEQPEVLNYLAYGWIEKNIHIEKSIEMLKLAFNKKPDSHYILDSLAWAYYKKNNFLRALELMEKVIEIAPGEAISLDHLGDIYFSLGREREAYFMWKQAFELAQPIDNIKKNIKIKINKYNAR